MAGARRNWGRWVLLGCLATPPHPLGKVGVVNIGVCGVEVCGGHNFFFSRESHISFRHVLANTCS